MRSALAGLLLPALLAAGAVDELSEGIRAFLEGRFRDALAAFERAEAAAGDDAPPEILLNRALAALRLGEIDMAEAAAARAAARGGADFAALEVFIRGSTDFVRCERAEAATDLPNAPLRAFDTAIAHAERARIRWQEAATARPDWPEARRNAERAILKIEELRERRERSREARRPKESRPVPRPVPETRESAPETDGPRVPEEAPRPPAAARELSEAEVQALLRTLAEKEKERRKSRRAERETRTAGGRDW